MSSPYVLHGFNPSPYSVKMRAILRYRRIPFVWDSIGNPRDIAVAAGLPPVIPILRFPDARLMNDSTPLLRQQEKHIQDLKPDRRHVNESTDTILFT